MIGKTIIELDRVDSTNSYARRLLRKGPVEEGLVISASEQFEGRGQGGNTWQAEPGKNLTFSVVLHPLFLDPSLQFMLNKAVSLAIAGFMVSYAENISIKWPNDIYLGPNKIAGILIEHDVLAGTLETSIAGIGININQTQYSREIPNPVSLVQVLRREMALREALGSVCRFLDDRYQQLRNGMYGQLDADYAEMLLGADEWRSFKSDEKLFEGKIEGVDDLGRLLLRRRNGERHAFNHKEIDLLLKS